MASSLSLLLLICTVNMYSEAQVVRIMKVANLTNMVVTSTFAANQIDLNASMSELFFVCHKCVVLRIFYTSVRYISDSTSVRLISIVEFVVGLQRSIRRRLAAMYV